MTLKGQNALRDVDRASFGARHENLKEDIDAYYQLTGISAQFISTAVCTNVRQNRRRDERC